MNTRWNIKRSFSSPPESTTTIIVFTGYGDTEQSSEFAQHVQHIARTHGIECKVAPVCQIKDGSVAIETMLNDAKKFTEQQCDTPNLILVGHSLGGLMALNTARALQDKINIASVVAASPPVNHWKDYMEPSLSSKPSRAFAWQDRGTFVGPGRMIYTRAFVEELTNLVEKVSKAPALRCPIHIIRAADDTLVLPSSVDAFAKKLSVSNDVRSHLIAKGGHTYSDEAGYDIQNVMRETLQPKPSIISQFAHAVKETLGAVREVLRTDMVPEWRFARPMLASTALVFATASAAAFLAGRDKVEFKGGQPTSAQISTYQDFFHSPVATSDAHVILNGKDIGSIDTVYEKRPTLILSALGGSSPYVMNEPNGKRLYVGSIMAATM